MDEARQSGRATVPDLIVARRAAQAQADASSYERTQQSLRRTTESLERARVAAAEYLRGAR